MVSTASIAVPCGVLGGIVLVGFVFFWCEPSSPFRSQPLIVELGWFPRTWNKGQDEEIAELAGGTEEVREERAANHLAARGVVARAIAREQALKRGEQPSDEPIGRYMPVVIDCRLFPVVPAFWHERMRQREEGKRGNRAPAAVPVPGLSRFDSMVLV